MASAGSAGRTLAPLCGAGERRRDGGFGCRTLSFRLEKPLGNSRPQWRKMTHPARRPATTVASFVDCSNASSGAIGSSPHVLSDLTLGYDGKDVKSIASTKKTVEAEDDARRADLDRWIRESVGEIVKNIGEAPFLVHVYSDGGNGEGSPPETSVDSVGSLKLVREKAEAERWPLIRGRWESGGGCRAPNGIILVEELGRECEEEEEAEAWEIGRTRVWGVLIQGRGVESSACYLLKTCQVGSVVGFCTHFCLARADCGGGSAFSQLQNLWLHRQP